MAAAEESVEPDTKRATETLGSATEQPTDLSCISAQRVLPADLRRTERRPRRRSVRRVVRLGTTKRPRPISQVRRDDQKLLASSPSIPRSETHKCHRRGHQQKSPNDQSSRLRLPLRRRPDRNDLLELP